MTPDLRNEACWLDGSFLYGMRDMGSGIINDQGRLLSHYALPIHYSYFDLEFEKGTNDHENLGSGI